MNRKVGRSESPRKIELTSLIDVIFLLLIFFLVTMRVIPSTRGAGLREGMYSIRALRSTERSRAPALVVLKRLQSPNGNWATYYVLVTSRPGPGGWTQVHMWNSIRAATTVTELQGVVANAPLRVTFSQQAGALTAGLTGASQVIITTGTDNGYTFTYGEVNELIRIFKRPSSMVTDWYISPRSAANYPYGAGGLSFPQLPVRRVF